MYQAKHATITVALIAFLIMSSTTMRAQLALASPVDPQQMRERIMEMKKQRLVEKLELTADQKSKFIPLYEAGQKRVDVAKENLDTMVSKLRAIVKNGNDQDIVSGTDELFKALDQLNAAIRDRVVTLKPILNHKQYARLLMFEIRFPEMMQKMIMKRGLGTAGVKNDSTMQSGK